MFEFRDHKNLLGSHAYLSASKYHWINYDDEKLVESYKRYLAVERGTKLHDFARQCIELKQELPRWNKTLNLYVNDAIDFLMIPEQPLYYSSNSFGTADAIKFADNFLRIHDLKTGETPASMHQLEVYAALFFLEYGKEFKLKPSKVDIELRIYQNNEITICEPDKDGIEEIMDKIVHYDKLINSINSEE